MSTIHSIFKDNIDYTVLGNSTRSSGITYIVLTRKTSLDKTADISKYFCNDVSNVIIVESSEIGHRLEDSIKKLPGLRVIIPHTPLNIGQQINLAATLVTTENFLVLFDDVEILSRVNKIEEGVAVVTPVVTINGSKIASTITLPVSNKSKYSFMKVMPSNEYKVSISPFDYCGFYSTKIFFEVGGYDKAFSSNYWQLIDFGIRCYMFDYMIQSSFTFRISYNNVKQSLIPDNYDYRLFLLKNNLVEINNDVVSISNKNKRSYLLRFGLFSSNIHRELKQNIDLQLKRKYKYSLSEVISTWDKYIK